MSKMANLHAEHVTDLASYQKGVEDLRYRIVSRLIAEEQSIKAEFASGMPTLAHLLLIARVVNEEAK